MKLNLGCGAKRLTGFTGVDLVKTAAVDVSHDLNIFPYPFATNSAEEIILDNVLEHLDDVLKVMAEVHRLAVPGALIKIRVPYFKSNSAFTDPTHKHFFSETSFKYFTADNPLNFYSTARFKIIKTELSAFAAAPDARHFFRNRLPFKRALNYFLFNIYDEIYFELKAVK